MGLENHLHLQKPLIIFERKFDRVLSLLLNYVTQRKKPAAIANIEKALNI